MNQPPTAKKPLAGLLTAQFFGAFNDNAWKLIVPLLGISAIAGATDHDLQSSITLAFVVFTLPLMLFSVPAGLFADRVSKRTIIVAMKSVEIALMAGGTLALLLAPEAHWLLIAILGLMGLQSALFSPAKYGILPELLPRSRLPAG